ncbi:MAG: 3-oxoacyl-ACP reductase FabG [Candidatus Methanoperedens sp.]|nr:3-oxoacyl-ACP reductase FabG [Candidatus Methanoperedens sp.]MCZ7370315.1 3-oxoacyl-ACP reductase FabG [Candidatus Methanoperedens sp.]
MKLKGMVAVVTGSGTGIGQAIAAYFAAEGASVTVNCHERKAQETVDRIKKVGGKYTVVQADVSNANEVDRLIGKTVEKFGRLDILVNNAGIFRLHLAHETSEEEWDSVIDVNLKGAFLCSKRAIPEMLRNENDGIKGRIINIASVAGIVGFPASPAYCASKGGLILLTKEMALDYSPHININAICPGVIETTMTSDLLKDEATRKDLMSATPAGRAGRPEEIAGAAVFLASHDADFITGASLVVDGGWTIK